ncbi:MAG TPA: autotransporter assembly complex family protein, partial [Gammaproteobacteria bacterium]|nr:autotransporter assembly complex family protein [Gammaproteobacteria bacterium]
RMTVLLRTLRTRGCRLAWLGLALPLAAALGVGAARADVELLGLDPAQSANVRAYLDFVDEPCDAPAWRVEQQYDGAPAKIRSALEALGYYEPKIAASLERGGPCWHAKFAVSVGPPTLVRNLDVQLAGESAADAAFVNAREQSPLKLGAVLHHGDYEALKRRWLDLAAERGYPDAKFTDNRIDVYPMERVADVVLHFDSGKRYRFGEISFQQEVLSDELIRSYVKIHRGDPYDGRELSALYTSLANSGYFLNIEVRPQQADSATDEIPVEIVLSGAKRRFITYGLGYSTDTGPRLRFSRTNRRVNEQGHQFGINAQVSPLVSEITVNYRMPINDPRTDWVAFDAGVKRETTDTADSDSLQIGVRRATSRAHGWIRITMVNFLVEDFTVGAETGRAQLLMPGVDWTRVHSDSTIRANHGSKLELEARGAADALLSDSSFVQVILHGKWIWSPSQHARILLRSELGAMRQSDFAALPPSVRFFAGGDNSVRGYDYKSLGPTDSTGAVIGGSELAVASLEYEHNVRPHWSVAMFVDSGNAFDRGAFDAKTGAGIGARWQSPLGPIRVDVAHPFDDPNTNWRLHITLGPDL